MSNSKANGGKKSSTAIIFVAVFILGVLVMAIICLLGAKLLMKPKTLDQLAGKVKTTTADKVMGQISIGDTSLYDELPEISKYSKAVTGQGDVDIEIFTSGEKAGTDTDSWLIVAAEEFNDSDYKLSDGSSVSISVRSVASGLAADYIISGKYYPDLYTPSNTLFGEYAIANNASLTIAEERLVGNTAGILVKKDSSYETAEDVLAAVSSGEISLGFTNPQTSATGLNMLLTVMKSADGSVSSDAAIDAFTSFNEHIPYIATTTQQMRDSASNGTLDAMVSEYQAYINNKNLVSIYKFIPFGARHDNPLYVVNRGEKTENELEAIDMICEFLTSDSIQEIATKDGFNAYDEYASAIEVSGAEVTEALTVYKANKDNGQDIIAVFVADCSGSMSGAPINELKESLINGCNYINSTNYIGLVSYSSDVTIELPIDRFNTTQQSYFIGATNRLTANGTTSTYEAVCVAAKMVEEALEEHPDAKPMIFVLSDGYANGNYKLSGITSAIQDTEIPVYTIAYGDDADTEQLKELSNINEAASISADVDDVVYQIKVLFNSTL